MRRSRRLAIPVVAFALLTGAAPALGADSTRVWMTTGDRTNLLTQQSDASMGAPAQGVPTIAVDPSQRFQKIDGFGASITDSSASVLYGLSPTAREQAMRRLFDPVAGIGRASCRERVSSVV